MTDHVFERDDDVVMGRYVASRLSTHNRPVINDGASYWAYSPETGVWVALDRVEVKRAAMALSGAPLFVSKSKNDHGEDVIKTKPLNISNSRLNGIVELVGDTLEQKQFFDHHVQGIAFTNGFVTVDARGVARKPNSPDWRCRLSLPFAYHVKKDGQDFDAPKWMAFLKDIVRDDEDGDDKIACLQEFIGLSLVGGATWKEKAIMLLGDGGNGKSVFLDVVQAMFPSRNLSSIPPQQLSDEYYKARLDGVMLNVVSELPKRDIVDSPSLNGCISGDLVTARRPRENPFDFRPQAGHIMSVNPPLPAVADMSRGFWRRFIVITLNRNYELDPMKKDKELFVKELKAEIKGIVRWAIDGAVRIHKNGKYTVPKSSFEALAQWRTRTDQVALFASERTVRTENVQDMMAGEDLYRAYRKWGEQTGHRALLALSSFTERLKMAGFKPLEDGGQTLYPIRTDDATAPARQWALAGIKPVQSPLLPGVEDEDGTD